MKKIILSIMMIFSVAFYLPQTAFADFKEAPVGFVVIDKSGNVTGEIYSSWRQVVKWAYHFPDYKITDSQLPQQIVAEKMREDNKLTAAFAEMADMSKVDVLVVAKVYYLDEYITTTGFGLREDSSTYVRIDLAADLYVYRKADNKLLSKKVRERELKEIGNYKHPENILRMEISKIVNTMENRPIIGSIN